MHKKTKVLIILVVLLSGFLATLISGLYQRYSWGLGGSLIEYGFPFSWWFKSSTTSHVIIIQYKFSLRHFLIDVSFWSLIALIILAVIVYRRKYSM